MPINGNLRLSVLLNPASRHDILLCHCLQALDNFFFANRSWIKFVSPGKKTPNQYHMFDPSPQTEVPTLQSTGG